MLYPSMSTLLKKIGNRYLLVNVVARRARELAELSEELENPLEEKPVSLAIEEIADGELKIVPRRHREETDAFAAELTAGVSPAGAEAPEGFAGPDAAEAPAAALPEDAPAHPPEDAPEESAETPSAEAGEAPAEQPEDDAAF